MDFFNYQVHQTEDGLQEICAAYACKNGTWEIAFEVCICPDIKYLQGLVEAETNEKGIND